MLWVEDDPIITKTFPMEAAAVNLELVPFGCWKDAEEALTTDFSRWSAIILDARCKYKKGDQDNATRFLTNVLSKIGVICTQHHRIIPWYILTGGSDEELNDLIIEDREKWEGIVSDYEKALEDFDRTNWAISPEAIRSYRERAAWLRPLKWDFYRMLSSAEGGDQYWDLLNGFARGEKSTAELLSFIDKKVQMMRMEGN